MRGRCSDLATVLQGRGKVFCPIVLDYSEEFLPNENWDGSSKAPRRQCAANFVRNAPWPLIPTALSQKLRPHVR